MIPGRRPALSWSLLAALTSHPVAPPGALAAVALPTAAAAYVAFEASRLRRIPRLPEVALALDQVFGTHRPGQPLQLAVMGDSVASGVGATCAETSFPGVLAELASATLDRPVRVRSLGRTGARVADVRAEQLPALRQLGPLDAVAFSLGTNDATHLTPADRFAQDLRMVCAEVHEACGAPILLTGMPEFRCLRALGPPLRTVAGVLGRRIHELQREIADEHDAIVFVDVVSDVREAFFADPSLLAEDNYHPSDAGAARLAQAVVTPLLQVLERPAAA